ncbi:hypothetical protein CBS101457_001836 [Exobasidium rhododendri]|nr:hypothetical protein CBS101457_001836 [Exobasidium rhododendri]
MAPADPTALSSQRRNHLRILTLNVWGLAFISKAKEIRIPAIATRLAASNYDVVALQEIWCESTDWKILRNRCSVHFPYSKFFYSGSFGSGLAILSRYPIISTQTKPYSLNGHPVMVHHGDWIVAKAAGCATLDVPGLGPLDVWVTHTVAAGGEDGTESRRAHRITQAYELAKFARISAERGHHVICTGDFNSTPPSLSIAVLRDVGLLTDAYLQSHPHLPAHAISLPNQRGVRPDPRRCLAELGITCDSPLNTWTAGKPLDDRALKGAGKRLDYIFFRGPSSSSKTSDTGDSESSKSSDTPKEGRLRCIDSSVVFTELIEGHEVSYSDHFGLEATLEIMEKSQVNGALPSEEDGQFAYNSRLSQTLTSSLSALSAALMASRQSQKSHFVLFLALLILALCTIGFSSSRRMGGGALSGLWTFIAVICGWTGSTAFYSAVVWGEWEKRALRTFLEAMELDLTMQRGGTLTSPVLSQSSLSPAASPRIGGPEVTSAKSISPFEQHQQRLINVDDDSN